MGKRLSGWWCGGMALIGCLAGMVPGVAQTRAWPTMPFKDLNHIRTSADGTIIILEGKKQYAIIDARTGESWIAGEKTSGERVLYVSEPVSTIIIAGNEQMELFDVAERKNLAANAVYTPFEYFAVSEDEILLQFYKISQLTGTRDDLSLQSIKRATGKSRWNFLPFKESALNAALSEDGSVVYVLTKERLFAFDNSNGIKLWDTKIPGAFDKPVAHGGEIFQKDGAVFITQEGMTVIDGKSGERLWSHSYDVLIPMGGRIPKILAGASAAPIITDDAVYTAGKGKIRKFDRASGKKLWESRNYKAVPNMQLVGDELLFQTGGIFVPSLYPHGVSGQWFASGSLSQFTQDGSLRKINDETVWIGKPGAGALDATTGKVKYYSEGKKNYVAVKQQRTATLTVEEEHRLLSEFIDASDFTGWLLADRETVQRLGRDGSISLVMDYKSIQVGDKLRLLKHGSDYLLIGKDGIARINLDRQETLWVRPAKKFLFVGRTSKHVVGFIKKEFTVLDAEVGDIVWQMRVPETHWIVSLEGQFICFERDDLIELYTF